MKTFIIRWSFAPPVALLLV